MKGKKKKRPAVIPVIIVLILLCILIAGLFYLLFTPSSGGPKPVYEEDYVSSNRLKETTAKVDYLIYEALYNEGVNEEDISFSKVIPEHKNDLDWDFTELSVRVESHDSMDRLPKTISKKIAVLQPDVLLRTEKITGDEALLNITIYDFSTHRIKLHYRVKKGGKTGQLPKVAIIIDDIGYDESMALSFTELDIPVCLSVLPDAPYSRKIASRAVEKGVELLLHLPMEPKGYPEVDPGKGALMTSMARETIQGIVKEYILEFPGLKGVNHHMGSLFSENYVKMKYVIDEIKKFDLYYVDSRTTNKTVAFKVAKALGVPAAEKSLFIDNDLSEKALKYQMERLMGIARYSGSAVGIGHPHAETLNILKRYTEQLKKNYEVVPVSELVE